MMLAAAGKTDLEIAQDIGISRSTLSLWKNNAGEGFSDTLKEAKDIADQMVELSLFRRAVGYTCPEVKVFYDRKRGKIIEHEVLKHHAPDTTAGTFWLTNRKSKDWKHRVEVEVEPIDEMDFD